MNPHLNERCDRSRNRLLAALPDANWLLWAPSLEPVELAAGDVLYQTGNALTHVWFPTTCRISIVYQSKTGRSAEIAVIGQEGVVGISLMFGSGSASRRAVVQAAGQAYRLTTESVKQAYLLGGDVHQMLLKSTTDAFGGSARESGRSEPAKRTAAQL